MTFESATKQPFSGVVLAGGRSTRMGCEKALLEVEGRPQWQRQRDVLVASGASEIFLSARPEQSWPRRATGFHAILLDATADCGPLSGITAALERASHPHVAVLAIDLPKMNAKWFSRLLADAAPGAGVVGKRNEFFEPLAAVYPREIKWLAWEALAGGKYSLQTLLARAVEKGLMRPREIADDEADWFTNWNR